MPGTPVTTQTTATGFYGKAVTHGDFLSRHLPNAFLKPWDAWLQRGLAASRAQLGKEWLPHYLSAPIWRFALPANVCGNRPVAGVWMPSVDAVGRHFPMTLACLLTDKALTPVEIFSEKQDWFSQCEEAALTCLEESFTVESLNTRLDSLASLSEKNGADGKNSADSCASNPNPDWNALSQAAWDALAKEKHGNYSLWWSTGSDVIPPAILTHSGLPGEKAFARLLSGVEYESPLS